MEKDEIKKCHLCEKEENVSDRRIFIKKEALCDNCYQEKLKATQKYLIILNIVCIVPILIGLWLDISEATDFEFGTCTLIIGGIMGLLTASGLPKWILNVDSSFVKSLDDSYGQAWNFAAMSGNMVSTENTILYLALKIVILFFKIVLACIFFVFYVLYNITRLYNVILVRKNVNGKLRIAIIFGTYFLLYCLFIVNFG